MPQGSGTKVRPAPFPRHLRLRTIRGALVQEDQLMAYTLQQSEKLRSALEADDIASALETLLDCSVLSQEESLVVLSILTAEMIELLATLQLDEESTSLDVRLSTFFDAFERHGRSAELYQSISRQLYILDAEVTTDLLVSLTLMCVTGIRQSLSETSRPTIAESTYPDIEHQGKILRWNPAASLYVDAQGNYYERFQVVPGGSWFVMSKFAFDLMQDQFRHDTAKESRKVRWWKR